VPSRAMRRWLLGLVFLVLFAAWSIRSMHIPFTRTAATHVPAEPLEIPPLNLDLMSLQVSAPRTVYPYSVIPGGIASVEELKKVMDDRPDIARHLEGFNLEKAKLVRVTEPRSVYVSYRRGEGFFWTTRRLTLAKGELLITDENHTLRGRCGNDVSDAPREPTSSSEPTIKELETPLLASNVSSQPDSMPPPSLDFLPSGVSPNGSLPLIPLSDAPPPIPGALPANPTPASPNPDPPSADYFVPPFLYPPFIPTGNSAVPHSAPPNSMPEPSTLLLVFLASAGIGAKRLWEKRK